MSIEISTWLVWVIVHLGSLSLILLTAAGISSPLLRQVSFHSRLERVVYTMTLGLGLSGLVLFLLGLVGLLFREVIIAATIIGSCAAIIPFVRTHQGRWVESLKRWKEACRPRGPLTIIALLLGFCYWLLLLLTTQYPPMDWDATMYHLVLARQYLTDHQIFIHAGVVFPVLPLLNHMLFTWALALKDDILAQMIEHLFLMLTALGLYAWGRRQGQPQVGLAAAAFWLAHPLVLWLSESAYVDTGLTCFALLGISALRNFRDEGSDAWWRLGLALLAFAAGVKIPGLVFLAVGAWFGVWACLRSKLTWSQLAVGWLLGLVLAAPWYAFIAAQTGNPVWPLFTQFSHGLWGDRSVAEGLDVFVTGAGVPKTPINFVLLPFHLIFQPALFLPDNHLPLFPLIAAWPLAWVMAWRDRSIRWWTLWGLAFTVFWFCSSQQVRLWIPAVPLVGLAICESCAWLSRRIPRSAIPARLIGSAFVLTAVLYGAVAILARIHQKGWPPLQPQAREEFLATRWSNYPAVRYVNEHADQNDAVYVINCSWVNYYFKPRVVDSAGLLQRSVRPTFNWPADQRWVQWLDNQRVKWIFINLINLSPPLKPNSTDPAVISSWPDYQLVYADSQTWVFHHQPAQP